jgi:hypothetical protein
MPKETMTRQIHPDAQDAFINTYTLFGWELVSSQIVTDNYQEMRGDTLYQVREKSANVSLVRDTNMKNYSELASLQKKYEAVPSAPYPPSAFSLPWVIITVIGLAAYVVPGVLIIIWRITSTRKKREYYEQLAAKYHAQEEEILRRCRQLV